MALILGIDMWQSHMTLTRGSQRLRLTVNVQIGLSGSILQGFIKLEDQICELNYRGTKSEIEDKLGDQKCNFTLLLYYYFSFSPLLVKRGVSVAM